MVDTTLTHLVFILDRSGSMSGDKAVEAENGVRKLLKDQIALPGQRLEVTVARFDNDYELLVDALPADRVVPEALKIEPRGMTALFDAIGRTAIHVGRVLSEREEHQRPGRVTILIATDGMENCSNEFSGERLRQIIDEQQNVYGWEFVFMGTSRESMMQAQAVGISSNTSYASTNTSKGIRSSYGVASNSLLRSRTKGAGSKTMVTEEDRKNLE